MGQGILVPCMLEVEDGDGLQGLGIIGFKRECMKEQRFGLVPVLEALLSEAAVVVHASSVWGKGRRPAEGFGGFFAASRVRGKEQAQRVMGIGEFGRGFHGGA